MRLSLGVKQSLAIVAIIALALTIYLPFLILDVVAEVSATFESSRMYRALSDFYVSPLGYKVFTPVDWLMKHICW